MTNWEIAKNLANEIDLQIIETLDRGDSFRVEAGAGAGKTYSLMRVVEWLEKEKHQLLRKKGHKIACITYTNRAVDEIKSRLKSEDFIRPCTIHNFAWSCMNRFQSSLIKIVGELDLLPFNEEGTEKILLDSVKKVGYELGVRYMEDGVLYLHHNDVIAIFVRLLDNAKFRMILAKNYPIILIDEYQDTFRSVMEQFLKYFIEPGNKPQFGLFGDAWQTIYTDNGACGEVTSNKLVVINKGVNFRSEEVIVAALNKIRPELPQISASDEHDGRIIVITTDDYRGQRQTRYYKGELPDNILFPFIDKVREKLATLGWAANTKTLMLTHKMLAKQQHYENLLAVLGNHLKEANDEHFLFFMNRVEPVYSALIDNNPKNLFEALGAERRPIQSVAQKKHWQALRENLAVARTQKIINVLKTVQASRLIGLPPKIEKFLNAYLNDEKTIEYCHKPIEIFYNIDYSEIINAIEFQKPETDYSTDHGVKGEEYNNVILIMGRGWNNYKFDELLYQKNELVGEQDYTAYIRNRNLFYVCCSRPKKRLAIFITVPVNNSFRSYLNNVFGAENVMNYNQFLYYS